MAMNPLNLPTAQGTGMGPGMPLTPPSQNLSPLPSSAPPRPGQAQVKTKAKSNPTLEQLQAWVNQDIGFWNLRQTRMQDDQERYELVKPEVSEGDEVVLFNDARTLVVKLAGMFSKHKYSIEVLPRIPQFTQIAQKIEDALRYWDKEMELNYVSGLRASLKFEEAESVLLRGWIASRIMFDPSFDPDQPDNVFPAKFDLYDAANLYPRAMNGKLGRVVHQYYATIDDVLNDPSLTEAGKLYKTETNTTRQILVTAVYAYNTSWDFHAVYSADGFLKKPMAIGYMPWIIIPANGAFYRGTSWDTSGNYVSQIGVSVFDAAKNQIDDLNQVASMMKTLLAGEANPSIGYEGDQEEKVAQVDLKPGAKFVIEKGGAVHPMVQGPDPARYNILVDQLQRRVDQSTIPAALFGATTPDSALVTTTITAAAEDLLMPYLQALELYRSLKYRKLLELFVKFSPPNAQIWVPTQPTQADPTGSWSTLTAEEVAENGFHVSVKYNKLSYQDKAALLQAIIPAVTNNIFSGEEARGHDWLNMENPSLEEMRMLREKIWLSQDFVRAMIPVALSETGDELLLRIYQQTMAAGQQAMPQGPGGPGGPGQAPSMPNLPGQALPPGAAGPQTATAPIDIASMLRQRMGNIGGMPGIGGSGLGGVPPATPPGGNPMAP